MWLIIIFIIIIQIIGSLLIRLNSKKIKASYRLKDKKEIIEKRIFAKKNYIIFLFLTFIGPLPLGLTLIFIYNEIVRMLIVGMICIIISSLVFLSHYFWTIEGITHSIIEEEIVQKRTNPDTGVNLKQ